MASLDTTLDGGGVDPAPSVVIPPVEAGVERAVARSVSPSARIVPIVCPGHNRPVVEVSFSEKTADGIFHIAASLDSKAMLRNGETGDWIGTFEGHKGAVWSAKLNATATKAATGSADFSVKLWDAVTGDEIHTWNHHKHIVKSVDFSFDEASLATGGRDKKAFVLDLETLSDSVMATFEHPAAVTRVLWYGEKLLLTGAEDGMVRTWDTRASGGPVRVIPVGTCVTDMELSYDRSTVSVAAGKTVEFFDAQSSDFASLMKHEMKFVQKSLSLSPDKSQFLTAAKEKEWIYIYDYRTGNEINCQKGHHGEVLAVRYAPGGTSYSSGAHDATLRLWKQE